MNKEKFRFSTDYYDDSPEGRDFIYLESEGSYEDAPIEFARELGV